MPRGTYPSLVVSKGQQRVVGRWHAVGEYIIFSNELCYTALHYCTDFSVLVVRLDNHIDSPKRKAVPHAVGRHHTAIPGN